jgi:MYXO-CTERM domain-containing protein
MSKKLTLLSLPAILLLGAQSAKADLNVNLFDEGSDFKIVVSGSLSQLGTPVSYDDCGISGLISAPNVICTGIDAYSPLYGISGPDGFGGSGAIAPADSVMGPFFAFGADVLYGIDSSYIVGQPFLSSATFNNTNLAALGFTVPGLAGTWNINGTSESINVFIGPPPTPPTPPSEVPGPLPLFGAGAAFGWSRRMRRRISAPVITPPQS